MHPGDMHLLSHDDCQVRDSGPTDLDMTGGHDYCQLGPVARAGEGTGLDLGLGGSIPQMEHRAGSGSPSEGDGDVAGVRTHRRDPVGISLFRSVVPKQ